MASDSIRHIRHTDRIWFGEQLDTGHTCLFASLAHIHHNDTHIVFATTVQSSLDQFPNLLDILVALTLPDNGTNRTG